MADIESLLKLKDEDLAQVVQKLTLEQKTTLKTNLKKISTALENSEKIEGSKRRFAVVERKTKETQIRCELNLDGTGEKIDVNTGIGKIISIQNRFTSCGLSSKCSFGLISLSHQDFWTTCSTHWLNTDTLIYYCTAKAI